MQNDNVQSKAAPVRAAKKSDGWREREEAKAAGVAPRTDVRASDATLVRC